MSIHDDFSARMKKIDDDFKKSMEELDERRRKFDESFAERKKKFDDEIAKLDSESEARMKKFLETRGKNNKMIEKLQKNIYEITKNNPILADHFEEVKKMLARGDTDGARKISGNNIEEFIEILGRDNPGKGKTH